MGKKIKAPNGKVVDLGIYGDLSKSGLKDLQKMMGEGPRKKEVRKTEKKK